MIDYAERLREKGIPFKANDNISQHLSKDDLKAIQKDVEEKVAALLKALVIDVENDPNTKGAAERIARMYMTEVFAGRYLPAPKDSRITRKTDDRLHSISRYFLWPSCLRA